MDLDALAVLAAGIAFLIAYVLEDPKDNLIYKYTFLFVAIVLIGGSFYLSSNAPNPTNQTTYTNTTIHNVPLYCIANASTLAESDYYLSSMPSGGQNYLYNTPQGILSQNKTILSGTASGQYLVAKYITNISSPQISKYSNGIYQLHIHASTNGSATLFGQIWVFAGGVGNDEDIFMLGQTSHSTILTTNNTPYTLSFNSNYSYVVNPSDRLALYVYANITAFSVPLNITLYSGGGNNSHISIPRLIGNNVCPSINEVSNSTQTTSYNYGPDGSTNWAGAGILLLLFLVFGVFIWKIAKAFRP